MLSGSSKKIFSFNLITTISVEISHPVTHKILFYQSSRPYSNLESKRDSFDIASLSGYKCCIGLLFTEFTKFHYTKQKIFLMQFEEVSESFILFQKKMIWERSQSYKSASPILRKLNIGHRFFHFSFEFHFLNAKSSRGRVNAY